MRFFGLTIAEVATLVGLLGTFSAWLMWVAKKAYKTVKDNISDPIKQNLNSLSAAITHLSNIVDSETNWTHERHSEVVEKLETHDERLVDHNIKLVKHEQQIKTLFRKEK
ncbi:hypothetical protein I6N96_02250 [Enterococcus sp. BWM-S5]|uniref:Phage protein n=1 Tax=Enterococcus larvae TaxID=2794352 RepID=A0ABS4CG20_9ENTE|nr:hypothetical protein [Enterococcus larvae]MBP1045086.1 hypothetical protein [Enterococcus larvae]